MSIDSRIVDSHGTPVPVPGPYEIRAVVAIPTEAAQDELNRLVTEGGYLPSDIDIRGPVPFPATQTHQITGQQVQTMLPALYVIIKKPMTDD